MGGLGTAAAISAFFGVSLPAGFQQQETTEEDEEEHHYVNWSNTHEAHPRFVFEPQTEDDLQLIVERAHKKGKLALLCSHRLLKYLFSTP